MSAVAVVGGLFLGACAQVYAQSRLVRSAAWRHAACALLLIVGGCFGLVWCFVSPPPLSQPVANRPVAHALNDPLSSVYFGNGCFWHTQYDLVSVEQAGTGAFSPGRAGKGVTSLVGYAGGDWKSPGAGTACYHGVPGTDYGRLGHAEAVSVVIDPERATEQVRKRHKLDSEV